MANVRANRFPPGVRVPQPAPTTLIYSSVMSACAELANHIWAALPDLGTEARDGLDPDDYGGVLVHAITTTDHSRAQPVTAGQLSVPYALQPYPGGYLATVEQPVVYLAGLSGAGRSPELAEEQLLSLVWAALCPPPAVLRAVRSCRYTFPRPLLTAES